MVVVEAGEKSGALITADFALEQGRDVFSVPGKVDSYTSRGTNKLIKQGAKLIETSDDIFEELELEIARCTKKNISLSPVLDKIESLVYNLLSSEPKHIGELCEASTLGMGEISRALLSLEMKRFARQLPGKNFVKDSGGQ